MRRSYYLAAVGVITACLVSWVAFAGAQSPEGVPPGLGSLPPIPGSTPPPSLPEAKMPPAPALEVEPNRGAPSPIPVPPVPTPVVNPGTSSPLPPTGTEDTGESLTAPGVPATIPGAAMPSPASLGEQPNALVTPEMAVGRQEPAVSIEWIGNPIAKIGAPANYSLVVRNVCNIPVQQVMVRVRIPAGMSVQATEPRAQTENGIHVWDLGTLMVKQERVIQMKLQADAKGDVTPQAWVSFTGSSVMRIRIREPKLQLKCSCSEKVLVGDAAAFTLTVSNPGDGSADMVKIRAVLSEGLEHARGNKIDFDIGNLAAGESRNVTLLCATRAGGVQTCEASAEADGGLIAKDSVSMNVIMPRLDLQLVGPRLRYLDRKAIYALRVTNPGDAPASNVTVANMVPAGFKVLAASDGGRHDFQTRTVSWFLGEVGPGQTREVKLEVQAVNAGDHEHRATAIGARGLRAESKLMTKVEGLSAILVEMVDTEDPIEAGGDTSYEVRITNTGSKSEKDIRLVATIPDRMLFKNAQGPVRYREEGKKIFFEAIPELAPRADAIIRINVKAVEAGTVRFQIDVTSQNLVKPVVQMEATRIYSDSMEPEQTGTSGTGTTGTGTTGTATPPVTPPGLPGGLPKPPEPE